MGVVGREGLIHFNISGPLREGWDKTLPLKQKENIQRFPNLFRSWPRSMRVGLPLQLPRRKHLDPSEPLVDADQKIVVDVAGVLMRL